MPEPKASSIKSMVWPPNMQNILITRQSVRMMLLPIMPSVRKSVRVSVRISVISVGISVRVSDRPRQFKTKFWFSSGLLCFWDASGFFLHEPMWNPCWFHMNIYELCNQTSHMDCFNACLLWQKLGSIKWQGLTPCMTYKMTQGVTNAGWQKPGSIKWQCLTPCIHHKTGPPLWPLHCCGHCRCSLLALCCSKFFLGLALLLRCLWLLFAWAYVKPLLVSYEYIYIYMNCATRVATWIASMHACSGKS